MGPNPKAGRRRLWRIVIGVGYFAFLHAVAANLIINGSFEFVGAEPGSPASTYTTDYRAVGTNTLTGWTSSVTSEINSANYLSTFGSTANWIPDPFLGNYSMQLDSSTTTGIYSGGNSLSQTISLTADVTYHLSFYMSAEAARGQATTSALDVILNGGGLSNLTTSFTVSQTGTDTKASPNWVLQTLDFTPSVSGDVVLTFRDIYFPNGTSSNASLDNVELVAVVPEAANGAIVAAVCLTLVLWRSRRRISGATGAIFASVRLRGLD